MKKNVVITVRGLQPEINADEPIEVVSAGTYMRNKESHYLSYEEADDNGRITKNRIKIMPELIEMVKQGTVATQMRFALGEKQFACYETPFGEFTLGMLTKEITLKEEEGLDARLCYSLEINGEHVSDCELNIEVRDVL